MRHAEVPINVVGQTGGSLGTQFSSCLTLNAYINYSESAEKKGIFDFPGLKLSSEGEGADRGFHVMGSTLYLLNGTTLQSVDQHGTRTDLGTVLGSERAIFADDGTNLCFTCNGVINKWDGATLGTVSQSVISNPQSIAYLNRQFLISGDDGLFAVSDVGSADSYNALNYAEAESDPDALYRVYVFSQLAYFCGAKSTETWWNSGEGNPPFNRQDSALINIGLAGKHAIANTDQYLYWLSDNRSFYKCIGSSTKEVMTADVASVIGAMADISDCICSTLKINNQQFLLLSFPSANKTFLYSETLDYWVRLSSSEYYPGDRWYGNAVIRCYEKNLVADYRNGNIYELDKDTYTDNGDTRLRIRVLPSITGALIGAPGRRITVSGLRLTCQVGIGLETGQGSDPVLMCKSSNDGGHTWGPERHISIGELGDYVRTINFDDFANGYNIRHMISFSDPVQFTLFDEAFVRLRASGH